jgi:hypothetical protein
VLRSWFDVRERCPVCGLYFERGEQGYYLGAGALQSDRGRARLRASGWSAVVLLTWPHPPWTASSGAASAVMILLPVLFFPFSKTLWLAFDLIFRPSVPGDTESRPAPDGYVSPFEVPRDRDIDARSAATNVGAMGERGREAGHSLVELLIAAALLALVMAATLSILQSGLAAFGVGLRSCRGAAGGAGGSRAHGP